jgi:1-deoxy-D-xylulose-5-phosphate reductoisomerase
VAVAAFHEGALRFTGIVDVIADVLSSHDVVSDRLTLDDVLAADAWARESAADLIRH